MKYLMYFICVILITMAITYIGAIKEKNVENDLTKKLYSKCSYKIIKYLKKNKNANLNDIQNQIKGIDTSMFWTRKKIKVQDINKFSKVLMENLFKEDKVSITTKNNRKVYNIK